MLVLFEGEDATMNPRKSVSHWPPNGPVSKSVGRKIRYLGEAFQKRKEKWLGISY